MQIGNMPVSKSYVLCLFLLLCYGCQRKYNIVDYISWVENTENKLCKEVKHGDFEIKLLYKPIMYIAAKEKSRGRIQNDSIQPFLKTLEGMQYYDLTVDVAGSEVPLPEYDVQNSQEHYQKLNYYMFGFKNDIYIMEAGRELPCRLYHFERTFNLTKHTTFLLAFDQEKQYRDSTKTLVIQSPDLGVLKITIEGNTLKNIPEVEI